MLAQVLVVLAAAALVPLGCASASGNAAAGTAGSSGGPAGAAAGGRAGRSGAAGAAGASQLGGAGAGGAQEDQDALIVPAALRVSLEEGGAGVLDLFALTLQNGPDGLELYAALKNEGDVPACDAALKVQFFDAFGQPLGSWIAGLHTAHFYRYTLPDGSTTIAACASPGDVTMAAIPTMATDLPLGDVASVVYYYSYFALDAVAVDGLVVSAVNSVATDGGVRYAGTVTNQLDVPVTNPAVTVFPLNHVGRPLGVITAGDDSQLSPGGSWTFQTAPVTTAAVDYAAYPSASFSN
jgi:hypothetical protein